MAEEVAKKKWEKVPGFEFKDIIYEKRPGVAIITINRPQGYNAFTAGTMKELGKAFEDAANDDMVGVVVFTGAGNKAFRTGGDAKEAEAGYSSEMFRAPNIHALIKEMPKPVIAAVNGFAIGGGQVLQQLCDLSISLGDSPVWASRCYGGELRFCLWHCLSDQSCRREKGAGNLLPLATIYG
jgi:naphthoate synthase